MRYRFSTAVLMALLVGGCLQAEDKPAGSSPATDQPADWSALMPEGRGKEYATSLCSRCHNIGVLILQKRTRAGWRDSLLGMNSARDTGGELCACLGGPISDDEIELLSSYLSEAFGPKNPIDQLPLNVNTASRNALLRVPGLGALDVQEIIVRRKRAPLRTMHDLENLLGIDKVRQLEKFLDIKDSMFRGDGMLTM